ncbi:hypothetical protein LPB41_03530 [Thalassospira sp. MA62]|nr:hypothetical protein [Thalassospira sp. MA62]
MKREIIVLTQGSIDNAYLKLSGITDLFPENSIGGSNKGSAAGVALAIHYGADKPAITDIAADKMIFRERTWVSEFFQIHDLTAGSKVVIEQTGEYRFHVYPARP